MLELAIARRARASPWTTARCGAKAPPTASTRSPRYRRECGPEAAARVPRAAPTRSRASRPGTAGRRSSTWPTSPWRCAPTTASGTRKGPGAIPKALWPRVTMNLKDVLGAPAGQDHDLRDDAARHLLHRHPRASVQARARSATSPPTRWSTSSASTALRPTGTATALRDPPRMKQTHDTRQEEARRLRPRGHQGPRHPGHRRAEDHLHVRLDRGRERRFRPPDQGARAPRARQAEGGRLRDRRHRGRGERPSGCSSTPATSSRTSCSPRCAPTTTSRSCGARAGSTGPPIPPRPRETPRARRRKPSRAAPCEPRARQARRRRRPAPRRSRSKAAASAPAREAPASQAGRLNAPHDRLRRPPMPAWIQDGLRRVREAPAAGDARRARRAQARGADLRARRSRRPARWRASASSPPSPRAPRSSRSTRRAAPSPRRASR